MLNYNAKNVTIDGPIADSDISNSHSAATTQASSPRPFCDDDDPMSVPLSKWEQVRDILVDSALDGNEILHKYGDMITCRETIERFLAGAKGNVEKAANQLQAHLEWRQEYRLDEILDEDFTELESRKEIYWGGYDLQGVPTLTWLIGKHAPSNHCPKQFVRFFVYQIEKGLRRSPKYPNAMFNIFVELTDAGLHNIDASVAALLQPILMKNYPKVRKGMFVFPMNWFVQLCWNTVLKPLISSLQPDIEDKICPLFGDYRIQLFARFAQDQVELAFGGTLDLAKSPAPVIIPYKSTDLSTIMDMERKRREAKTTTLHTTQKLASEKLVLLQSEARDIGIRRRRKSSQHRVQPATTGRDRDRARDSHSAVEGSGRPSLVLYYSLLAMLFATIWIGVTFWTASGLGLVLMLYMLQYRRHKHAADACSGVDATLIFDWANPSFIDRDTAAILQRLEDTSAGSGKAPAGGVGRRGKWWWEAAADSWCDYARRCGI